MSDEARRAIEAVLMVADQPVPAHLLAQLLEMAPDQIDAVCASMQAAYEADERGFVLDRVAGGYRFASHPDLAPYVERFVVEGQTTRLSDLGPIGPVLSHRKYRARSPLFTIVPAYVTPCTPFLSPPPLIFSP